MFAGIFGALQTASQRVAASAFTQSVLGGPQAQAVRGMAKLKTHKGTAKRWKAIAKGLYQRRQVGLRHLNRRLTPDSRRGKHSPVVCTPGQKRHLDRLLPYSQ
ncbi:hypothetical protein LPJ53_003042 [Coemansia erecta]|uniref:50S ribosomal protein L35 n=1 Tax=Coemansia erecta TaxID=147472 RepID=A0A9W8CQK6_9FUNG|nr:hypothetical protein LPJ53_003042 [Coemansia erecta]